jgi:hypothetical protein
MSYTIRDPSGVVEMHTNLKAAAYSATPLGWVFLALSFPGVVVAMLLDPALIS